MSGCGEGWLWSGSRGALMVTGSPASWLLWWPHSPTRVMNGDERWTTQTVSHRQGSWSWHHRATAPRNITAGESRVNGPRPLCTIFATPCYPTNCFQNMKFFTFSRVDLESDPYSLWTLWFEIVYLQTALNEEYSFARIYWSNMYDCLTSQLSQKYNFQRDQKYR